MVQLRREVFRLLVVTFAMAFVYEAYRGFVMTGVSQYDTPSLVGVSLLFSLVGIGIGYLAYRGPHWGRHVALLFVLAVIAGSIVLYNPVILPERDPGLIDHVENLLYTGLMIAVAILLLYDIRGVTLESKEVEQQET
jgi:hydrogenase/urease accessory protein HupE